MVRKTLENMTSLSTTIIKTKRGYIGRVYYDLDDKKIFIKSCQAKSQKEASDKVGELINEITFK